MDGPISSLVIGMLTSAPWVDDIPTARSGPMVPEEALADHLELRHN
jgi:hypothetical protein